MNSQYKISESKRVKQVQVPLQTLYAGTLRIFLFGRKKKYFTFVGSPHNQYSNYQSKARIEYEKENAETLYLPERCSENYWA